MVLWQAVHNHFRNSNIANAILELEAFLSSRDAQKFSCLIGASFSNPSSSVVDEINRFIHANETQFEVKAVYLEMNGFDINYDRWYFDLFAYSSYLPEFDETEWLCEWQSPHWPEVELFGMDAAREAFAWYHEQRIWKFQPDFEPVYEAAMLLVMAKFADFVGLALKETNLAKRIPVLATAHDFESVARFEA
ncbi:hypothetical protein FNU76_03555 [Chitinimonas arctica]|uniref:Uncharacterized protein n=1 Tax=Chitinimonas arctica TaxID=2594795 RepID=A0A516SBI2_9NEIS|nr:hypothetical protein [Chitinimonas arctica]QDQ25503.1 hypothetical protein FNU76_03555 [Chitinimonas arctica]